MKQLTTREEWLGKAMQELRKDFGNAGFTLPEKVRVSCGLPSHGAFATRKRVIGQAWATESSRDRHFEVFVSPTLDKPFAVLSTLAHELVHVAVGIKAGHRGDFVKCAAAVGLQGPWTSTTAGDRLASRLNGLVKKLGKYPHGSLDKMTDGRKKQTTRLIKVGCPACGYTTRITMVWIMTGIPCCPNEACERHGEPFEVDEVPGERGDGD